MTITKALEIAKQAHKDQKRWGNKEPYVNHPIRVSEKFDNPELKIVALLHDVVEDSDWTLNDLTEEGFNHDVVDAVDSLTRRKEENESYLDFILRVSNNVKASMVKIEDINDNLSDLKSGSLKDKYELSRFILSKSLQEKEILQGFYIETKNCKLSEDSMRRLKLFAKQLLYMNASEKGSISIIEASR